MLEEDLGKVEWYGIVASVAGWRSSRHLFT